MYDKIKAEVSQDYYRNNYPNEGTRFVAWYLRNIHLLDEVQARDCITDGKDDKQIDAIYIDSNAQKVYVVQGKFIGGSPIDAEPLREVLSSWILLKTNKIALQEGANAKLQQKLPELIAAVDEGYDICFELIATSSPTEGAKADLAVFQQEMMNSDDFCAEFHLVDNEGLSHRYDMALDKDNPYLEHGIDLQPGRFLRLKLGSTDAVIAVLPLKDCIKFPGIKDGGSICQECQKIARIESRQQKDKRNNL